MILQDKMHLFSNFRSPKVVAEWNDYQIKIIKLKGEFILTQPRRYR